MNTSKKASLIRSFSLYTLILSILSCQSGSVDPEHGESSTATESNTTFQSSLGESSSLDVAESSGTSSSSLASSSSGGGNSSEGGVSSEGSVSSQAEIQSSSSAATAGSATLRFLASDNSNLYQDIVFTLQSDSSYLVTLVPEVDLSKIIPAFDYTGKVVYGSTELTSGVTKIDFQDTCTVTFGEKSVVFHIQRQYAIPELDITTADSAEITSKTEYVSCSLNIDAKNMYADYSATDARIRLRGNSTRLYYDKKPYRIKLGSKAALLGLKADKDWVLLANYRDPTNFMNAATFDMARYLEMPYTNSNRFVEIYLNGSYIGMYQFTEQVEQGDNRVAIDEATGLLLSLDLDDGPDLSPDATDNFSSSVYELPVCVKNPDDRTSAQLDSIQEIFAQVENLMKAGDYDSLQAHLDVQSFIDFLIIQEITRNVELVSPRSMYMYQTSDQMWHFGPVWDFDGGFAFDWASMTTGHNYFGSQTWLMGSSNPSTHPDDAYNEIPGFFVDMFASESFVDAYQTRWNEVGTGMLEYVDQQLDDYVQHCDSAMARNAARWPIDKDYTTEIANLRSWLATRVSNYSSVVSGY
ncbi:MAG TPA: CotH kinase family protein [Fibrobacteraceae bacterium]|nr:CotH kinase family protein [Fibrobacteraceae bacterium]